MESECESDLSIEESIGYQTFSESSTKSIESVVKLELEAENVDEHEEISSPTFAEDLISVVKQEKLEPVISILPEWRPTYGWNSEDEDPERYFHD